MMVLTSFVIAALGIGALFCGIVLVLHLFHARQFPGDSQIASKVLRDMKLNADKYTGRSKNRLEVIGKGIKASCGSLYVGGSLVNLSILSEAMLERRMKKIWKMQGRKDEAKTQILNNLDTE